MKIYFSFEFRYLQQDCKNLEENQDE